MQELTLAEVDEIKREVGEQFSLLVAAINQKDAAAWAEHYSRDGFVSAIASTDSYVARNGWVDAITSHFASRKHQRLEPHEVAITPLAPNVALLTSEEGAEMELKSGEQIRFKHMFTMIWQKGQDGWEIVHSHESWNEHQAK